ncbi:lipase maturation factor 1-like [Halichondria panicea]|uniref:lipase maturation factor 1-like n=1 Tax=Halichondria panicea TaxID=6063 RepID=UPI00312B74C4
MSSSVRRRAVAASRKPAEDEVREKEAPVEQHLEMDAGTYWLTRIVFTRSIGFVYLVAFLVALNQNKELIGANGLLPIPVFYSRIRTALEVPANSTVTMDAFLKGPSLFWWISEHYVDLTLDLVAYLGISLSAILLFLGSGNVLIFVVLRVLYHSLVFVGQIWYAFGWEVQLLEIGFLALIMVPLFSLRQFPRGTPTPWVAVWANRWLLFRIMIGAGLIKIRGDECWGDLTCMDYHYETQPVPNPLSYFLHQSPAFVHKLETLGNHFVELVVPFLIFLPRPFRLTCGVVQIIFQVMLILSGNLSFLNWLTILSAIFCFDDLSLQWLFSAATKEKVVQLQQEAKKETAKPLGYYVRQVSNVGVALLLGYLSIPVVLNLLSQHQVMNTSFNSLKIVNTYGAFGSVTKSRTEVVLEGTFSSDPGPNASWLEIEFKCKPGRTDRRPCIISPYHYRLDWMMWFAAFQDYNNNPWLVHLAAKIVSEDPSVESLVEHNPFRNKPPKFIRAQHYQYTYARLGSKAADEGHWWERKLIGPYIPVVAKEHLQKVAKQQGWTWYNKTKS